MRILLLGGTGLLGEPAARALIGAGHDVTVHARGGRPFPEGAERLEGDRRDAEDLARVLGGRRFDLTVDFLAYDAPDVERLARVPGASFGRRVTISTGQVYLVARGAVPPFREPDAALPPIDEPEAGTRAHANWAYGMGKRRMEAALGELAGTAGTESWLLRLPVVQGAGDRTGRLFAYIERLLDGGPVIVPASLEQPLRFVWAEDVARVVAGLAASWPGGSGAVNLAQADIVSMRTFLVSLAAHLGVQASAVTCDEEELAPAGLDANVSPYSGRWCSVPDPALAIERLGFRPSRFMDWLPVVVDALREQRVASDVGYARRDDELRFARSRTVSVLS